MTPAEIAAGLTPASLRALQCTMERGGWLIDAVDVAVESRRVRIVLRSLDGGRRVTFDADGLGRASTTREVLGHEDVLVSQRSHNIFRATRITTKLLGRTRHAGLRSGLRWLADYIADNSCLALKSADARDAFRPVVIQVAAALEGTDR